jgi:hypothetical protein
VTNGAAAAHKRAKIANGNQSERLDGENHPKLQRSSIAVKAARTGQKATPTKKSSRAVRDRVVRGEIMAWTGSYSGLSLLHTSRHPASGQADWADEMGERYNRLATAVRCDKVEP